MYNLRTAQAIQQVSDGKLTILSIHNAVARQLLDKALPQGWDFAPYLVEVSGESVRAWTGFAMSVQFVHNLGIRRGVLAWNQVRMVLGTKDALLLSVRNPATAFACDPCVYNWCGPCRDCQGTACYNTCGLRCQ